MLRAALSLVDRCLRAGNIINPKVEAKNSHRGLDKRQTLHVLLWIVAVKDTEWFAAQVLAQTSKTETKLGDIVGKSRESQPLQDFHKLAPKFKT